MSLWCSQTFSDKHNNNSQTLSMSENFFPLLYVVSLSHRRDVRLIWGTVVVGHEGVELQRVELEAGVVDVLHVLHGVFVHGEQGGRLEGERVSSLGPHTVSIFLLCCNKRMWLGILYMSSTLILAVRVWQKCFCTVLFHIMCETPAAMGSGW